jgi:hypothetical protein
MYKKAKKSFRITLWLLHGICIYFFRGCVFSLDPSFNGRPKAPANLDFALS